MPASPFPITDHVKRLLRGHRVARAEQLAVAIRYLHEIDVLPGQWGDYVKAITALSAAFDKALARDPDEQRELRLASPTWMSPLGRQYAPTRVTWQPISERTSKYLAYGEFTAAARFLQRVEIRAVDTRDYMKAVNTFRYYLRHKIVGPKLDAVRETVPADLDPDMEAAHAAYSKVSSETFDQLLQERLAKLYPNDRDA